MRLWPISLPEWSETVHGDEPRWWPTARAIPPSCSAAPPSGFTGNLVSPGKISAGGSQVDGQIEEDHRPLPEIPVTDLDPAGKPLLRTLDAEVSGEIAGFARRSGDLRMGGDLYVSGSLSGLGVIVVAGRTTLSSVSLKSLQQVALVSRGDLTVTGQGQARPARLWSDSCIRRGT